MILQILFSEDSISVYMRLLMAIIAGGILGHERGKKRRAAGFRTHILVCLSSCAIMLTNIQMTNHFQIGDPTRMPAQVISGIGFLGAGCILLTDKNKIKGLTTAAGLWADACLGLCIGSGSYGIAIFCAVAIYLVLTVFRAMDHCIIGKYRYMQAFIEFSSADAITQFLKNLKERKIKVLGFDMVKNDSSTAAVMLECRFQKPITNEALLTEWIDQEGITHIEEL